MVINMNTFFQDNKAFIYFAIMALILVFVGMNQSWALALGIINMSLISAIMALGAIMADISDILICLLYTSPSPRDA